ncbi:tetratricopeptide repeat protein [uncultured Roseibium sp.]|uniref:tetratricopeptide repeat protein n=1 Tax=uncultured Roseibium sp. TaxID=1936171 RepID=UPI0032174550
MSDIFREVDEDIRHEKYRRLWDRFGPWVIGVAVLIVVGTGGYRGWLYWHEQNAQQAGDTFLEAVSLSEAGNYDEAEKMFATLNDATGGYPALARMRSATDLGNAGNITEAVAAFDALSRDSAVPEPLRDIAALRAAFLAVDTQEYSAIADRVEGLSGADSAFRAAAREVLALSAWKSGDIDTARRWISDLDADQETPADVSRRVGLLNDVIRAKYGDAPSEKGEAAQ